MNYKLFFVLCLSLFLFVGCQSNMYLSDSELKSRIVGANDFVFYSYDSDVTIVVNLANDLISASTQQTSNVDVVNRKAFSEGFISLGDGSDSLSLPFKSYVVDDFSYSFLMGSWHKDSLTEQVWASQNILGKALELLDLGSLHYEGVDSFKGEKYFVVRVDYMFSDVYDTYVAVLDSITLQSYDFGDYDTVLSTTLWVDRDTFVIRKIVENTHIETVVTETFFNRAVPLKISSDGVMVINDVNVPVSIVLPSDAKADVFTPGNLIPERTMFPAPLPNVDNAIIYAGLSGAGEVSIALRNNGGMPIHISDVSSGSGSCGGVVSGSKRLSLNDEPRNLNQVIKNGETFVISFNCVNDLVSKERFDEEVIIYYVNEYTALSSQVTGSISGRVY